MHRLKSRALGIALGGAALGGLAVGFTGAASASAATLNGGGYVAGWVYTSTNATVSSDGHGLYVLNRSADELAEFSVGPDAQLTAVGTQALPAGAAGVAAS